MATLAFNQFLYDAIPTGTEDEGIYYKAWEKGAMFDSRCFNIPEEEVINCFIWRQQDATRNAIQMLGQSNFSHKELHGKSCNDIQDMLMLQKGINFNDMPTEFKRGVCCVREEYAYPDEFMQTHQWRIRWVLDKEIPIFTQDRDYVERTFKEN
jgi:tRNA(His) 5'-end guanylyltransferase